MATDSTLTRSEWPAVYGIARVERGRERADRAGVRRLGLRFGLGDRRHQRVERFGERVELAARAGRRQPRVARRATRPSLRATSTAGRSARLSSRASEKLPTQREQTAPDGDDAEAAHRAARRGARRLVDRRRARRTPCRRPRRAGGTRTTRRRASIVPSAGSATRPPISNCRAAPGGSVLASDQPVADDGDARAARARRAPRRSAWSRLVARYSVPIGVVVEHASGTVTTRNGLRADPGDAVEVARRRPPADASDIGRPRGQRSARRPAAASVLWRTSTSTIASDSTRAATFSSSRSIVSSSCSRVDVVARARFRLIGVERRLERRVLGERRGLRAQLALASRLERARTAAGVDSRLATTVCRTWSRTRGEHHDEDHAQQQRRRSRRSPRGVLTSRRGGRRGPRHACVLDRQRQVDRRGPPGLHADRAGPLADALVPSDDRVLAGRHVRQLERCRRARES